MPCAPATTRWELALDVHLGQQLLTLKQRLHSVWWAEQRCDEYLERWSKLKSYIARRTEPNYPPVVRSEIEADIEAGLDLDLVRENGEIKADLALKFRRPWGGP